MKKIRRVGDGCVMDHRLLIVFLSWSSGLWAEDTHSPTVTPVDVRLVGGASRCAGSLEQNQQGHWETVDDQHYDWNLTQAAGVCRQLDCGSVVSFQRKQSSYDTARPNLFSLRKYQTSSFHLEINCSESVRLVNETGQCSGRLEVKSNQYNQSWSSVCEADFDHQDAEVVCRELGCGPPSVLQGALYGEVEAPVWTKEFQCGGHESALLDCDSSVRNTCSSRKAVELTCSEPRDLRLVGGASQCSGTLEMNHLGEWKPVYGRDWNLRLAGEVCGQLDCGTAVSTTRRENPSLTNTWGVKSGCKAFSLDRKCFTGVIQSTAALEITCSDSVRLVSGTNLCSGRLEMKSSQSNQSWSSVCEAGFDQQDAEVVCRELGCGPPSVFMGGLYGEMKTPTWTREFQCRGHESALLDCRSSDSARNTCSPGQAVGLTCSDPCVARLVGGANRCTGGLELKHQGHWKPVDTSDYHWNLKVTALLCRWLDCGSAISTGKKVDAARSVWWVNSSCVHSNFTLKECVTTRDDTSVSILEITCAESVRLVNGTGLCSGRLEVKSSQSNQSWSSVCDADFDLRDAEVVCRELGCGPPSVLQEALHGEVEETPVWSREFQCGGHESALLDCGESGSARNTCSPGQAVGLTCSDPENIKLTGENSRCAGTLEMKMKEEWRPVAYWDSEWDLRSAALVCRLLGCGSAVLTEMRDDSPDRFVWWIKPSCVRSASVLHECVIQTSYVQTYYSLGVICSDLLAQPNISLPHATYGVYEAKLQGLQIIMGSNFTITCSIEPQYPGGSFELNVLTTSNMVHVHTVPAVNHSAHFLFSAADHTHQGSYSCVYRINVFSLEFSSWTQPLYLTVSASLTELMIRLVILLLGVALLLAAVFFHSKRLQ